MMECKVHEPTAIGKQLTCIGVGLAHPSLAMACIRKEGHVKYYEYTYMC